MWSSTTNTSDIKQKKIQNFSIIGSEQKKALVSFTDFYPAPGIWVVH